ncbi:MAG TPA: MFS transporter [Elusimicrobiota bacterium]|jgi:MFS family permease|nr:MFS transporter [Elusimicrobiota bacterium]
MSAWRDLAKLPRPLWAQFFATLVNRMGTMALPFLVLYLTRHRGFTSERAASMLVLYGAGACVMGPVGGWLCDRFDAARVMTGALALSGLVLFIYPVAHAPAAVAAATLVWALASEAFRPAGLASTSTHAAPAQRKAAFALSRLATNLGMSFGPALGGFLAERSFPLLFRVDGCTSLLAAAVLVLGHARLSAGVPEGQPPGAEPAVALAAEAPRHSPWESFLGAWSDRRLRGMLLAFLPVALIFFQHDGAMPIYLVRDLGLPFSAYGMLFTINTVLIIFLEIPLNAAMESWPHRRSLSLGAALFGVGFGLLGVVKGFAGAAATVVVWTFGEMILFPSASSYIADISPERRRGAYMGLFTTIFSVAFMTGPWAGIRVMEVCGAASLWAACLAAGAVSAVFLARVR